MKTKLLITLTLLTFIFISANAQRNLKVYYVSIQGDTTRGSFIKYKNWDKSPKKLLFKKAKEKPFFLSPANTSMFQAEGQFKFYSFNGYRHLNDKDSVNETVKAHVFLKLIFESAGTRLYEMKDGLRSNYYIEKQNDVLTELVFSKRIENDQYIYNESFKAQIQALFEKELAEKNLTDDLSSLQYTDQTLINFFNALLGASSVKIKKLYKPEIFLAPAVSINRFHSILSDYRNNPGKFNVTVTPVYSAGIQFYDHKTSGRVFYAVSLSTYSFWNEVENQQGAIGLNVVKYEGSTISPCLHVGYNLLNQKAFQFYVQGGLGVMFFTKAEKTEYFKSSSGATVSIPEVTKFNYTENINLNLQAGITFFRTISFWGSYFVPMSMHNGDTEVAEHMPLECGIKVFLKRKY